jgi:hypothetical protein
VSDQFAQQHDELIEIADAILRVASGSGSETASELTRLRLSLSREVGRHCGGELELINARRGDTMPAQAALIRQYHDDLLKWRHDLIRYNSDWPPKRVFEDPDGFKRDFGPIVERLRARVQWEEELFYPTVLARAA